MSIRCSICDLYGLYNSYFSVIAALQYQGMHYQYGKYCHITITASYTAIILHYLPTQLFYVYVAALAS